MDTAVLEVPHRRGRTGVGQNAEQTTLEHANLEGVGGEPMLCGRNSERAGCDSTPGCFDFASRSGVSLVGQFLLDPNRRVTWV